MGKILDALGLMKKTEHQQILIKREDELYSEINSLRNTLKETNGQYLAALNDLSDAQIEINGLKECLDTKKESLDAAMMRNKELNSKNAKLEEENAKLKAEIEDLKSDRYLKKELPADRTKSKQVPKLKSFSKTSSIAKMMNT